MHRKRDVCRPAGRSASRDRGTSRVVATLVCERLVTRQLTAIDRSQTMVPAAQRATAPSSSQVVAEFLLGELDDRPWGRCFDAIFAVRVASLIANPSAGLPSARSRTAATCERLEMPKGTEPKHVLRRHGLAPERSRRERGRRGLGHLRVQDTMFHPRLCVEPRVCHTERAARVWGRHARTFWGGRA